MINMEELLALPDKEKEELIIYLQLSLNGYDISEDVKDEAICRLEKFRRGEGESFSLENYQQKIQDLKLRLKHGS